MVQESKRGDSNAACVVMTTHRAREENIQSALLLINKLPTVVQPTRLLRIFDRREGDSEKRDPKPKGNA